MERKASALRRSRGGIHPFIRVGPAAKYQHCEGGHGTARSVVVSQRAGQAACLIWTVRVENAASLLARRTQRGKGRVTGGCRRARRRPRRRACNRAPAEPHALPSASVPNAGTQAARALRPRRRRRFSRPANLRGGPFTCRVGRGAIAKGDRSGEMARPSARLAAPRTVSSFGPGAPSCPSGEARRRRHADAHHMMGAQYGLGPSPSLLWKTISTSRSASLNNRTMSEVQSW